MLVNVENESGYLFAMYGIGLSYGLTSNMSYGEFKYDYDMKCKLQDVSKKLYKKGDGHNKFLEHLNLQVIVDAPLYWWTEFDTYRVGMSKQSESTMHTITKTPFCYDMFHRFDFDEPIPYSVIERLEDLRQNKKWRQLKLELPTSFLQMRTLNFSYMTLRNIIKQRLDHKLVEWAYFCEQVYDQVLHPEYLEDLFAVDKVLKALEADCNG